MKRLALLLGLVLVFAMAAMAAPVERYFKFEVKSPQELEKLTRIISIDKVIDGEVYAYANEDQWSDFLRQGYMVELLPHPGTSHQPTMSDSKEALGQWDSYPTYEAYVSWMYSFDTNYHDICRVFSIGQSAEGREILFAKISDNVDVEEDEPEVMYTATMHGDETAGYILSIRLIDSLLTAYGTDPAITRMVDSMEIWINPAANPDGTYAGGNSSVYGATRGNANGVDLNRNYPDHEDGPHPDGYAWQIETQHFMALAEQQNFVISSNFHGGAEVFNYPWDTWIDRHPDEDWWYAKGREYADTVHLYSPSSYMDFRLNGVTNGYDWYSVAGGRQDYMNYYHGCREVTLELSDQKLLTASSLPNHWEWNKRSFINYLEEALYGVRGVVTDANTSQPVEARVFTVGRDVDSAASWVWSDPDVGDYHRMLDAGTYTMIFSAPGYYSDTVENIVVADGQSVRQDVQLVPLPDEPVLLFVEFEQSSSQPGDLVFLDVTLENIGAGNATGITAALSSDDGLVSVSQPSSAYPSMPALGGTGTNLTPFEFSIADTADLFHIVEFDLAVTDGVDYVDTVTFEYMIGDRVVLFLDDFSTDMGWTGYGGSAQWERDVPGGMGGDPSTDHSASSDNIAVGNDLTDDGEYNDGISPTQWLTSPVIDCSNHTGVELRFWQQLGCEDSQYDHVYFEVYDGTQWVQLYQNPGNSFQESVWSEQYY
ncbi:hypothetical protein GF377_03790, partial [candidate division GN15 bacterium]|nr:hypothetical protein [candidate division GN15 bacterium]